MPLAADFAKAHRRYRKMLQRLYIVPEGTPGAFRGPLLRRPAILPDGWADLSQAPGCIGEHRPVPRLSF